MVRYLCLWLLMMPIAAQANPARLRLTLASYTLELGQALAGDLCADGLARPLAATDLAPLKQDFAITDTRLEATITETGQCLKFRLYPRRRGQLPIPAIRLASSSTEMQTIRVHPAQVRGNALQPRFHVSSSNPWVREQLLVILELQTPDVFASLKVDMPVLDGFEVIPLPLGRQTVHTAHGDRFRLRAGWALFPLTAGPRELDLPPVRYRLEGGTRRRFAPPRLKLQVRPLPSYVPPTMLVGQPAIDSQLQAGPLMKTGQLAWWRMEIRAAGIPSRWLPRPDNLMKGGSDIQFLPETSSDLSSPDASGVNSRLVYRIPFSTKAYGLLHLPTIELQYFDPATGKIQRLVQQAWHPLVLPAVLRWLVILCLAASLLVLLRWTGSTVFRAWKKVQGRREALQRLLQASDCRSVRAALRCYAVAEGWPANLSLGQWQRRWRDRYQIDAVMSDALVLLDVCSYSGRPVIENEAVRRRLFQCLKQRKRLSPVRRMLPWSRV